MPDSPQGDEKPAVQRFPVVYTNATSMAFSIYDFRILFAEQRLGTADKVQHKNLVEVVMSPPHMKQFVKVMAEKLAEYEATFGTLPVVPPEEETAGDES